MFKVASYLVYPFVGTIFLTLLLRAFTKMLLLLPVIPITVVTGRILKQLTLPNDVPEKQNC